MVNTCEGSPRVVKSLTHTFKLFCFLSHLGVLCTWLGLSQPPCAGAKCAEEPSTPTSSTKNKTGSDNEVGTTITFTCDTGHQFVGGLVAMATPLPTTTTTTTVATVSGVRKIPLTYMFDENIFSVRRVTNSKYDDKEMDWDKATKLGKAQSNAFSSCCRDCGLAGFMETTVGSWKSDGTCECASSTDSNPFSNKNNRIGFKCWHDTSRKKRYAASKGRKRRRPSVDRSYTVSQDLEARKKRQAGDDATKRTVSCVDASGVVYWKWDYEIPSTCVSK